MSFEESLIHNASPTLASIKTASLYNFRFASEDECNRTIRHFNSIMNGKGIFVELLKSAKDFYLIYVYRKSHLVRELGDESIKKFLSDLGYSEGADLTECLTTLKHRLQACDGFPHEIGVFLGYPLLDVKSFIETGGRDFVFCGDWKAYHNEQYARCMFCKYKHCKEVYLKVYSGGRKFSDMLVSA